MAKISLRFDSSYPGKDGRCILKAMIVHQGRQLKIKELAHVKKKDWDTKKKQIKFSSSDFTREEIFGITDKVDEYRKNLRDIVVKENIDLYSIEELRNNILKICDGNETEKTSVSFLMSQYCELKKLSEKSRNSYDTAILKLQEFTNKEIIHINEIDHRLLESFESWMLERGNTINTIAVSMRVIRATCNFAIREGLMKYESYPFKLYKIKTARTKHRTIEIDDLRRLIAFKGTAAENKARDLFMLSFYLRGMNFKDLLYLSKQDIYRSRVFYSRAKTEANITVKVEPEAKVIFNRYKGSKYLLYFMEVKEAEIKQKGIKRKTPPHEDIISTTSKHLKIIFRKLDINVNISTYFARHTWATMARKFGDYDIVQQGLGHSDPRVTAIYIKYDDEEIDQTNRKVIDYLWEGISK